MKSYGEKLAWALDDRGMTQVSLNALACLPQNSINKWVNEQSLPSMVQALAVARILGLPLEWMADPDQTGPPPGPDMTEAERLVLKVVRRIGVEESLVRLAGGAREAG